WQKLPTFQGGANDQETAPAFRKWAARLVRNVIHNHWRAKHRPVRKPAGGGPAPEPPAPHSRAGAAPAASEQGPRASKHLRDQERDALIARALSTLERVDREIIRLHFFEDRSYGEIAGQLGIAYDQVRHRHKLLLEQLADRLGGLID